MEKTDRVIARVIPVGFLFCAAMMVPLLFLAGCDLSPKVATYAVRYDGNGQTGGVVPVDERTYNDGETVTIRGNTGDLIKSGYNFAGWNTAADAGGTDRAAGSTFTMGSADAVLYAKWTAIPTYSITYNGNGNTGGTVPVDGTRYLTGVSVPVADNTGSLVRTDYDFAGWNTAADAGGTDRAAGSSFTMGSADVVLYAKWTAIPTYSVTYDGNGNTGGTAPLDGNRYPAGATVTVNGNTGSLVRTGYAFRGWNTASDGSGTDRSAVSGFVMGSSDVVLYAKWIRTYAVTYDGNANTGGTVPVDATHYYNGSLVTVLGNSGSLERTGYNFTGWNTAADGSGTARASYSTFNMGTSNVILYAKWTLIPTYSVSYNGNGNTGGTVPVDGNAYLAFASVSVSGNTGSLTRTGHNFGGWNTLPDGNGTDRAAGSTFGLGMASVVLYAKWIPTFTVTYNGNGNTGGSEPVDSNRYLTGESVTVSSNGFSVGVVTFSYFERTGYTFSGWNTAANGSGTSRSSGSTFIMGSADVVLYAKWTVLPPPTYTVTYYGNGSMGGTVPVDPNRYMAGANVLVLGNTGGLFKVPHVFNGWNTSSAAGIPNRTPGTYFTMGSANVYLYAMWN